MPPKKKTTNHKGDSPLTRARSGTGDAFVELGDMREKAEKKSDGVRFTDDDLERTESNELRLTRSNSSEYTDFQSIGRKQGEVVVVSREIKSLRQEHHLRQRGIKQKIAGNTTQLNHTLSQANKMASKLDHQRTVIKVKHQKMPVSLQPLVRQIAAQGLSSKDITKFISFLENVDILLQADESHKELMQTANKFQGKIDECQSLIDDNDAEFQTHLERLEKRGRDAEAQERQRIIQASAYGRDLWGDLGDDFDDDEDDDDDDEDAAATALFDLSGKGGTKRKKSAGAGADRSRKSSGTGQGNAFSDALGGLMDGA